MPLRPVILNIIFKDSISLSGIGPRTANLLEKVGAKKLIDLIFTLPNTFIDRRYSPLISEIDSSRICTIKIKIDAHKPPHSKRTKLPYKVFCSDTTSNLTLIYFRSSSDYLLKLLPIGETRVVSGKIDLYNNEVQMTHPDFVVHPKEIQKIMRLEPVYPLTHGLTNKTFTNAINRSLEKIPDLPEWINPQLKKEKNWPSWRHAIITIHNPKSIEDLEPNSPARERLAYDELLSNQLALGLTRSKSTRSSGYKILGDNSLRQEVIENLPYSLTKDQTKVLSEIYADLGQEYRMLRLLQGDVGSGKTIVALLTMLVAVEDGGQAALLAPTEILAQQSFLSIKGICKNIGVNIGYLSSGLKNSYRKKLLLELKTGKLSILVGTHAIFQDDIEYSDLMIAVIDEQHRFGVNQRIQLYKKGNAVEMLLMTATPIPRTLTLTAYGDMNISKLYEKPPGRKRIETKLININRLEETIAAIKRAVTAGNKVFWVCPLIEESDKKELTAAEDRYNQLRLLFDEKVSLIHGRMKASEKDDIMRAFGKQSPQGPSILVATTVIEVGVDVPEASIMVIEHAERYGLSQLHQLRGRVGRGNKTSTCLLLYRNPLNKTAKARLNIIRDTEDGFIIAEKDLELRGTGELLGTKQSGLPEFRLADMQHHNGLLLTAHKDSKTIIQMDKTLKTKRGSNLRNLLYLFEQDTGIMSLRSG